MVGTARTGLAQLGQHCNLASVPRIYLGDIGRPAGGVTLEERLVT